MATGYQGYTGYDPERAKVDRARQMAELLQQGVTSGPTNIWGGLSRIGQAWLAQDARKDADKAESTYSDGRKRIADTLISQMYPDAQGVANEQLAAPAPFDLTPGGVQQRQQQGGMGDKVRSLAELLGGDVMGAIDYTEKMKPPGPDYQFLQGSDGSIGRGDKTSGTFQTLQPGTPKPDAANIRQVGNQIVERQPDGSWKPVYTGASAEDAARAFATFINLDTGEQMALMSDGKARGTGIKAYIPQQITSVGGVPTAINKRTLDTQPLSPLEGVAGNKAAIASAEVQGQAQGKAAFDLPTIEMRSQAAIRSLADLKGRNLGPRLGLQSKIYAVPGTEGADVQALIGQVTSQAFLNAFDQLRGAGAITEREGQAATAAVTRLQNQNITVGEALRAIDELEQYYKTGIEVARMKSTKAPVLPQMPVGAQGAQGAPDMSHLTLEQLNELERQLSQGEGQ